MTPAQLLGPPGIVRADVESIAEAAGRAPSIHNTQPWRWDFHDGVLDVRADRSRQLLVADADGHSLLISCGAAAELTQLALRAQGWAFDTARLPDPLDEDLLVRFTLVRRDLPDLVSMASLDAALARRSERRPFDAASTPDTVVDALRAAAAGPGVYADVVSDGDVAVELAVAVDRADRYQRHNPDLAAEMALWRRSDADDGIPDSVIPVVGHDPRHVDVALRDFEAGIPGGQLLASRIDEHPLIAVIFTASDGVEDRLEAGRSMMRMMVQAERSGIASCPLSQSVDLLSFRSRLRALMAWAGYPQMMLRLGRPPEGRPAPLTRRRPVQDTLTFR